MQPAEEEVIPDDPGTAVADDQTYGYEDYEDEQEEY